MKRSKHSLSHYKLMTADMGKLYPVSCFEVLPGDTVQQATSMLLRVSPLVAPVMHPVSIRVHHWFVPNRLVWEGWEDFITGGPDGLGGSSGAYPTVNVDGMALKSLSDYLGVPPNLTSTAGVVSALPYRCYALIYNENYRDQDLSPELPVLTSSGIDGTSGGIAIQQIAWEKDYFTGARPWAQKGADVSLPLGTVAPVVTDGTTIVWAENAAGTLNPTTLERTSAGAGSTIGAEGAGTASATMYYKSGMRADLTNATAVNVNDVRRAFALQRYQEARAMYGSRYTEYLRYLGVRSSDARLQRPEYLGGGKQTISFTEVLQTGPSAGGTGVADLKGHGIAAMRSRRYRRFFEEHGHVLSLMSVRPRTMYNDGIDRMWIRRTKEDYWQKELEQIGQQEILKREIYAAAAQPEAVWGYQDRYSEYRHIQSKVAGEMRTILNHWHMARIFAGEPVLNDSFVKCDPTKRIHQVQANDVLWVMASNSIQARRMVRRPGVGRIM